MCWLVGYGEEYQEGDQNIYNKFYFYQNIYNVILYFLLASMCWLVGYGEEYQEGDQNSTQLVIDRATRILGGVKRK